MDASKLICYRLDPSQSLNIQLSRRATASLTTPRYRRLTSFFLEAEGPSGVVVDEDGDFVAALAEVEVRQVARIDSVVASHVRI